MNRGQPVVLVIGAAGAMARHTVDVLGAHTPVHLLLADLPARAAPRPGRMHPSTSVEAIELDLFEAPSLDPVVARADLVVNAAGPFMRTAPPVIDACARHETPYLDLDDDVASTQDALMRDGAGRPPVAVLKGCGHSPGFTNVMAREVCDRLHEIDSIDVMWWLGDEGPHEYGAAVIEHWLDVITGDVPSWRNGGPAVVPAFGHSETVDVTSSHSLRLYEVGHPEPLSLARRYAQADRITCLGALHPAPVNGLSRGVAQAVERRAITLEQAVGWAQRAFADRPASLRVWRHALAGLLRQTRGGQVAPVASARFLARSALGRHDDWIGGAAVRARGRIDGVASTVSRRTAPPHRDSQLWSSLSAATGTAAAAFISLALELPAGRTGALFPEDWVAAGQFYRRLRALGVEVNDIVGPLELHQELE